MMSGPKSSFCIVTCLFFMLFISFIFILNLINNNLSYYYDILVHDLHPQMYIVKFSLPQHLNKEKRKRAAISTNGRRFDSFLTDHWNHQCLILNCIVRIHVCFSLPFFMAGNIHINPEQCLPGCHRVHLHRRHSLVRLPA